MSLQSISLVSSAFAEIGMKLAQGRLYASDKIIAVLPRSWETVGVGHMVLVHASAEDGWWEGVVTAREDDVLTLKYCDYRPARSDKGRT